MNISVAGTGYVGLVTGVCLADIGHFVTCVDIDEKKINLLKKGNTPIYEPGLEELIEKNIHTGRLSFTVNSTQAYSMPEIVIIAVGTPENHDGSANLTYVKNAAREIAQTLMNDGIILVKSTVPVGTNEEINKIVQSEKRKDIDIEVISNPEFLREGTAIYDMFNGDRIIIGSKNKEAAQKIETMYAPFDIPIIHTEIKSAEMIKYASNAFLATKISFINEIANICEKLGADITEVAHGIGTDKRIGEQFLRAGVGYGGSCFPKDTKALVQIAGNVEHHFELLQAVINVNNSQQEQLYYKAKTQLKTFKNKKIAILGLSFKPNTDDVRESPAIKIIKHLAQEGANIFAFDPVAIENAKTILGTKVNYCFDINEALKDAEAAFILTEWDEIKSIPLIEYRKLMRTPNIFDGRNSYSLHDAEKANVKYTSVGRKSIGF